MQTNNKNNRFQSSLAPLMEQFIHEKRACGYKYHAEARLLASFDRFFSTASEHKPLHHQKTPTQRGDRGDLWVQCARSNCVFWPANKDVPNRTRSKYLLQPRAADD